MTNKKMTKRELFTELLQVEGVKGVAKFEDFINHELELLAKKNSAEKKPTAVQVANEGIKSVILETLVANGGLMTITEMQKANKKLDELSNQRISALVKQLLNEELVTRVEEKRKAYFKAV